MLLTVMNVPSEEEVVVTYTHLSNIYVFVPSLIRFIFYAAIIIRQIQLALYHHDLISSFDPLLWFSLQTGFQHVEGWVGCLPPQLLGADGKCQCPAPGGGNHC